MSRSPRLHHANLLVGTALEAKLYLESLSENLGVRTKNNPDLIVFSSPVFGIEEARELNRLATRRSVGISKIFLITSSSLTSEAQNALLKTFEEPSSDTYFFLVVLNPGSILPTLRSRMQIVSIQSSKEKDYKEAKEFLSLSIKKRLLFAKSFVDEEKNLSAFLDELLLLSKDRKVYDMVTSARGFYSSPRLVLEHLAVVL